MTDQSIEDASRKEFEAWLKDTGRGWSEIAFEAWKAKSARQSISQSEPVAGYVSKLPITNPQSIRADANDVFKVPVYAAPIDNITVPVAEIRWIKHLEGKASEFHEYGSSEGKKLPVGTVFFTATPQVKEMLENAAKIADECSGDGINPACAEVAQRIRALIPDTQAKKSSCNFC
jgi:hypothetical protein